MGSEKTGRVACCRVVLCRLCVNWPLQSNACGTFVGIWFFHCHKKIHAEIGQAMVFKVGSPEEWGAPPDDFPSCGSFGTEEAPTRKSMIQEIYKTT